MNSIKSIIIAFLTIVASANLAAQNDLTIEISNLSDPSGQIAMELLDHEREPVSQTFHAVSDTKIVIEFKDLAAGQYAVRYYHDLNMNEKLDKNFVGIPTEGYGFSNDAYGAFGPKDFKEWLFTVNGNTTVQMTTAN